MRAITQRSKSGRKSIGVAESQICKSDIRFSLSFFLLLLFTCDSFNSIGQTTTSVRQPVYGHPVVINQESLNSLALERKETIVHGLIVHINGIKLTNAIRQINANSMNIGYILQLNTQLLEMGIGAFRHGSNDVVCISLQK